MVAPVDEGIGSMIAFLLDRDPPTAADQISNAIRLIVGREESLLKVDALATLNSVYRSKHAANVGDVKLLHLLLDMTNRGKALHG